MMRTHLYALVVPLVFWSRTLHAQGAPQLRLGIGVTDLWTEGGDPSAPERARGAALLANGEFWIHGFGVRFGYTDGTLSNSGAAKGETALVEGSVVAAARVSDWLSLEGGVRSQRVTQSVPERWVTWLAGVRLELPLLGRSLRGHVALYQGVHTEVNLPRPSGSTHAAEAGLTADLPGGRLSASLVASADRSEASAGPLREVDAVRLTIGVRLP